MSLPHGESTAAYVACADTLMSNLNLNGHVPAASVCLRDLDGMATTISKKANVDGTTRKFACLTPGIEVHTLASRDSGHIRTHLPAVLDQECRQIQIGPRPKTWTGPRVQVARPRATYLHLLLMISPAHLSGPDLLTRVVVVVVQTSGRGTCRLVSRNGQQAKHPGLDTIRHFQKSA